MPGQAKKSFRLNARCGMFVHALLLACLNPLPASAGSTFPEHADPRRVEEAGPPPPRDTAAPQPANRRRDEIKADIEALEAERANLLTRFASAHPDVRAVERRLQTRRKQLEMLEAESPAPK